MDRSGAALLPSILLFVQHELDSYFEEIRLSLLCYLGRLNNFGTCFILNRFISP